MDAGCGPNVGEALGYTDRQARIRNRAADGQQPIYPGLLGLGDDRVQPVGVGFAGGEVTVVIEPTDLGHRKTIPPATRCQNRPATPEPTTEVKEPIDDTGTVLRARAVEPNGGALP